MLQQPLTDKRDGQATTLSSGGSSSSSCCSSSSSGSSRGGGGGGGGVVAVVSIAAAAAAADASRWIYLRFFGQALASFRLLALFARFHASSERLLQVLVLASPVPLVLWLPVRRLTSVIGGWWP